MNNSTREIIYRRVTTINHPISGQPVGCNFMLTLKDNGELVSDICGATTQSFKRDISPMAHEVYVEYEKFLDDVLTDLQKSNQLAGVKYEHIPGADISTVSKFGL